MSASTEEQDRAEILEVSEKWWKANIDLDIPKLRECFPAGDKFLMFNLNSFTYFGVAELEKLWEKLHTMFKAPFLDAQHVRVMKLDISGDMAWLACEAVCIRDGKLNASRDTEIYRRDNGEGGKEWRMWHFHSSALAFDFSDRPLFTTSMPRLAFDDTLADRGVGNIPGSSPIAEFKTNIEKLVY